MLKEFAMFALHALVSREQVEGLEPRGRVISMRVMQ